MSTERVLTTVVIGTAALAAAGAGVVLGIESNNQASAAQALRQTISSCAGVTSPDCQKLASEVSAQNSDHVASSVLWVTSGILAVGAAGAFFLWPRGSLKGAGVVSVTPAVGPTSAGLSATGTF